MCGTRVSAEASLFILCQIWHMNRCRMKLCLDIKIYNISQTYIVKQKTASGKAMIKLLNSGFGSLHFEYLLECLCCGFLGFACLFGGVVWLIFFSCNTTAG